MTNGQDAVEKREMAESNREEALELASQRRRRFLVFCLLLIAVALGANLLYGTVLFTRENRSYCLRCHRTAAQALMWEASERHPAGFTCAPCHAVLPGRKVRWGAFSAHADTVNPNCIGCHESVVQGRPLNKVVEVRFRVSRDGGTAPKTYRWTLDELMYGWHLKSRVCLCTDCHRNIAHERESKAFGHRPKMSTCKACHYHAVKDDYVRISPLPMLEVKEVTEGVRDQGSGPPAYKEAKEY